MKTKLVLLVAISILLLKCSSYNLVSEKEMLAKGLKLKGDKRVSYFIYDANLKRTFTLSEPPPDAILEKTTKIANNVIAKNETAKTNVTADQKLELANKVITLGERTVAVNILRDALFRLSEMNVNNRNTALETSYKSLFDSILSVSRTIAIADKAKSDSEKAKQETAKVNAEIALKELDLDLDAQTNYQIAIKYLLDKDEANSLYTFKTLYEKYPTHFNIDEINKKLKDLSKSNMDDVKWKELYQFIIKDRLHRIDENLQKALIKAAK